ncbi:glycosyltransferase family 4 protein [Vibrio breoganii]
MKVRHVQIAFTESSFIYHNLAKIQAKAKDQISILSYKHYSGEKIREDVCIRGCNSSTFRFLRELFSSRVDVIHFHNVQLVMLALPFLIFNFPRTATCTTVHTSRSNYNFLNLIFFYLNLVFINKIVFCSNASRLSFYIPRILKHKCHVINNGIDYKLMRKYSSNRENVNRNSSAIYKFISVGRFIPIKNHIYTLKLLNEHFRGNWLLTIIGSGSDIEETKSYIENNNLKDRVRIISSLPREDVYKELAEHDFFISSSKLEGLPMSPLEALCIGLRCILSDIPAHHVFSEGDITLLFPVDNYESAAKVLNKVENISIEQDKIDQFIVKKFSADTMIKAYRETYLR